MNNSGSDFSTVKVGDRLWLRDNLYEGWVNVKAVYLTNFRVFVNSYEAWVSKDGKWADDGPQVLFWDKVEIIPPPRPKSQATYKILSREEIETFANRQSIGPERVDLPGEMVGRIVEALLQCTMPEESPYPEPEPTEPKQKSLVKKTVTIWPYKLNDGKTRVTTIESPPDSCGPAQTIEIEVEE